MALANFPDGLQTPSIFGSGTNGTGHLDLRAGMGNYTGEVRLAGGARTYGAGSVTLTRIANETLTIPLSGVANQLRALEFGGTWAQNANAGVFSATFLFDASYTHTNNADVTVQTLTADQSFVSRPTMSVLTDATHNVTHNGYIGVIAKPVYGNTGAGTLTSSATGLQFQTPAALGGGTLSASGITLSTVIGLDFQDLAPAGVTSGMSIRSAGTTTQMRHAGPAVFGANAAPTNTSVALEVQGTTGDFRVAQLTTAQETALTAVTGMIHYNTSLGSLRYFKVNAWVSI